MLNWSIGGNLILHPRDTVLCTYRGYTLIQFCTGETFFRIYIYIYILAPLSSRHLSRNTIPSRYTILKTFCSRYSSERHSALGTYQGYSLIYVCMSVSGRHCSRYVSRIHYVLRMYVRTWAMMLTVWTANSRSLGQHF